MNFNDITFLSATFNKHDFTLQMLKSLYSVTNGNMPKIVILDNSTEIYFPKIDNDFIYVLNNTNFKYTKNYNQPSMNHCASLDFALKQIKTKYVLLCDNDIIFKENFIHFFSDFKSYDIIGEIGYDRVPPKRLYPYLCLINNEFVNYNKINYFDEKRCMIKNATMDTGCSFYEDCAAKYAKIKNVRISNFIIHLKGGTLRNKSIENFKNFH